MKNFLNDWNFFTLSKEEYQQSMNEIFKNNLYSLHLVNRVVMVLALCFAFVPIVIEQNYPRGAVYISTAIIAAVFALIVRWKSKQSKSKHLISKSFIYTMIVLYYINIVTFGLWLGVWSNRDGAAVTFMCLMICAFFLFICPIKFSFWMTVGAMVVFSISTFLYKETSLWVLDIINVLMAGCLGMIVTWEITRLRVISATTVNRAKVASRRSVILGMSLLAEGRDEDTGSHISRIQQYTEILARKVHENDSEKLSQEEMEQVILYSPLHDIGKVSIPDSILLKPGKLTAEEFDAMKGHTSFGGDVLTQTEHQMVTDTETIRVAIEIAKYHHEKFDGSGYPEGLKGNSIPVSAQIVALADIYDALTSKRIYKDAFEHELACDIILNGDGRTEPQHFSPDVLNAFAQTIDIFREINENRDNCEAPLFERKL
ncbi:MAG: HD domain-containing protein [Lachnospiraceae bacterium]|nr:HD domain-containing protein [Lachnospiraceae bacterium]